MNRSIYPNIFEIKYKVIYGFLFRTKNTHKCTTFDQKKSENFSGTIC